MNKKKFLIIILISFIFQSCSLKYDPVSHNPSDKELQIIDNLYAHYEKWKGVKYCYGGFSFDGIDCSGFIYITYKERFKLIIPRTTKKQRDIGKKVSINKLQAGDLIFFNTGYNNRHVGIYIEKGKFIHASSSKGVMISNLKNPYWQKAVRFAKRIEELYR